MPDTDTDPTDPDTWTPWTPPNSPVVPEGSANPYDPIVTTVDTRKRSWLLPALIATIVAVIAAGIGLAVVLRLADENEPVVTAETPPACVEALATAQLIFDEVAVFANAVSDGFDAAAEFDADALADATDRMDGVNTRVTELQPIWATARDACLVGID